MATEYRPAGEAFDLAQPLIAEHHEHLALAPIIFIFRDVATKKNGATKWGQAKILSGLNAAIAGLHELDPGDRYSDDALREPGKVGIVELALDIWELIGEEARVALVDHELSHFAFDLVDGLSLLPHDIEEFAAVVQRHGSWNHDISEFARRAGRQLTMFSDDGKGL